MQDIETVRENMAILQDDILYLENKLDSLDPDSLAAESTERILNVKWRLYEEQRDIFERLECNSAREAAEHRLQYHIDNDTLDLY